MEMVCRNCVGPVLLLDRMKLMEGVQAIASLVPVAQRPVEDAETDISIIRACDNSDPNIPGRLLQQVSRTPLPSPSLINSRRNTPRCKEAIPTSFRSV